MKKPRTLAVRHPRDPGRPTVIRAENYDPEVHELWDEGAPKKGTPKGASKGAPRNAPRRARRSDPAHGVGELRKDPSSIPVERGHLPAGDPPPDQVEG